MKKVFISLAVLLLVSMIFASCGTPAQTTTPPATTPSSTPTKTVPPTTAPPKTTPPTTSTPSPTVVTPKYGGTLRVIYDAPPSGSIGYPQELIGDATFAPQLVIEPLIRENNKGEWTPWLAESYKLADDHSSKSPSSWGEPPVLFS